MEGPEQASPTAVFDLPPVGMSHEAAGVDKAIYSPLCCCKEPKGLSNEGSRGSNSAAHVREITIIMTEVWVEK